MNKKLKAYRIEDPIEGHGLWRDFDGSENPVFGKLTVGKCKDMPMEDSDFYRYDGKQWFSATDEPWKMRAWFDVVDVVELERLGYRLFEFEISNCRIVSNFEIVFTRDSILSVTEIDPSGIWDDYVAVKGCVEDG